MLFYGNVRCPQASHLCREAVAQEAQARIFPGLLDSIFLQKGDPGVGTGFLADSMSLWRTPTEDKSLKNWELVATIPLTG